MHFVYKLDHLFQSTRVSHVISSVTKTFHFLSLFQLKTFFASNMQHSKTHTENSTLGDFICYFFMHLMIYFQLNDLEIGKGYNLNSEKVETWHVIRPKSITILYCDLTLFIDICHFKVLSLCCFGLFYTVCN